MNGFSFFSGKTLGPQGNLYTLVLVSFGKTFPKVMESLAPWFWKKKFGIWQVALQSKKPTVVSWLLFSTPLMDIDILKATITSMINGVPISLVQWKMILLGMQGLVPDDQKIKALHVYINKLNVPMAKPLLMQLYASKNCRRP